MSRLVFLCTAAILYMGLLKVLGGILSDLLPSRPVGAVLLLFVLLLLIPVALVGASRLLEWIRSYYRP